MPAGSLFVLARRNTNLSIDRFVPASAKSARGAGLSPTRRRLSSSFALIVPIVFYRDRYLLDLAILIVTYTMLGFGLNIVVGLAGLLDLGYVAFYAVGAYSFALLAHVSDCVLDACRSPASSPRFAGMLLGFPVLRLRGDYLAIVTLGFGEIIRLVLLNWSDLTGGPNGIAGIPRPSFFGLPFNSSEHGFAATFGLRIHSATQRTVFLYYLILALALLTNWLTLRLRRLPIGRAWEALREDEIACRALGINPTAMKLTAFAIGAMFGGFAGAFFATRQGFISPESFTFTGIGARAGDRRARRHGLSDRRRASPRRVMLGAFELLPRIRPVSHAHLRRRHGRHHDLPAARPCRHTGAVGFAPRA